MIRARKMPLQHVLLIPFLGLTLLSVSVVGIVFMHNGNQALVDRTVRIFLESGSVNGSSYYVSLPEVT